MKTRSSLFAFFLLANAAHAADCPPGAPSCKVITLTPDEEKVLLGPNGILDTAQQGRPLDLGSLVAYFRQKIGSAVAGEVKTPAVDAGKDVPVPKSDPRK